MKDFIRKNWPLLPLLLFAAVVYRRWFSFAIYTHGDWTFTFKETVISRTILTIWRPDWSFGVVDPFLWRLPLNLAYRVFAALGFDTNFADPILVFWPMVLTLVIGGFVLIRKITGSTAGAVVGSLIVTFNTYYLAIDTQGHYLLPAAGGFAILSLWAFFNGLERRGPAWPVLAGLLMSVSGFLDLRVAYIAAWVVLFCALASGAADWRVSGPKTAARRAAAALSPLVVLVLLNSFWIFPTLFGSGLAGSSMLNMEFFGGQFWNLRSALALFMPFWTGGSLEWFKAQPIPPRFWLIPIAAFLGAWLNRKNARVLFFAFLALLGAFLAKQGDPPGGWIYHWLYDHLPGFNAFREATKFYFFIVIGYAVLIGAGVGSVWSYPVRRKWQTPAKYALIGVIALLFAWNAKPLITGEIDQMFRQRQVPPPYLALNDTIGRQPGYFRLLTVPRSSRWLMSTNLHPKINAGELDDLAVTESVEAAGHDVDPTTGDQGPYSLGKVYLDNLLDAAAVKYVIVPMEGADSGENVYYNLGLGADYFVAELDKLNYLRKTDSGAGGFAVYENEGAKPHIYLTREKESLESRVPFEEAAFQAVSPSEYRVSLRGLAAPAFLNFSDVFDPQWKLHAGGFNWTAALFGGRDYFFPDDRHSKNAVGFNSFLLDPEDIRAHCRDGQCRVDPDGSIDAELTLYFWPQGVFVAGSMVSAAALLGCLSLLACEYFRRKRRRAPDVAPV